MTLPLPRLYNELAAWWPLLSPPSDYEEEATHLLSRLGSVPGSSPTLLELAGNTLPSRGEGRGPPGSCSRDL